MILLTNVRKRTVHALFSIALLCATGIVEAAPSRTIVFISDLHMGIGRDADNNWYPTEDFRWPKALDGFLTHISKEGNAAVDLVIVGDLLDLWQPPANIRCKGPNADFGCSIAETREIVRAVIAGHQDDFKALTKFASKGKNCIHVLPGNHDAALLIDDIWSQVAKALKANKACVKRIDSGRWTSADGRVAAEHGHQIGWDPNRYDEWPKVTQTINGVVYLRRPWGEQFVQKIFNKKEEHSPLVDNLSPNSAGAWYYLKDRDIAASVTEVANFLKFNLLETSLSQKISVLGEEADPEASPEWDVKGARLLGWKLFAGALAPDQVLGDTLSDPTAGEKLELALGDLVHDTDQLSKEEVMALCDQLAVRGGDTQCPTMSAKKLGSIVSKLASSRKRTVGPYVEKIWEDNNRLRFFVYGHTHAYEKEWEHKISSRVSVHVLNDGAFLRLIDDAKFRKILASKPKPLSPGEGLSVLPVEDLPACYTFVRVTQSSTGGLNRELKAWYMEENETGKVIDICDPICANVGHGCD